MDDIDFVIEVYRIWPKDKQREYVYMNRFIPVGTTASDFDTDPFCAFKGRFHTGFALSLDSPILTCYARFIRPVDHDKT